MHILRIAFLNSPPPPPLSPLPPPSPLYILHFSLPPQFIPTSALTMFLTTLLWFLAIPLHHAIPELSGIAVVYHNIDLHGMRTHLKIWQSDLSSSPKNSKLFSLILTQKTHELNFLANSILATATPLPSNTSISPLPATPPRPPALLSRHCLTGKFFFLFLFRDLFHRSLSLANLGCKKRSEGILHVFFSKIILGWAKVGFLFCIRVGQIKQKYYCGCWLVSLFLICCFFPEFKRGAPTGEAEFFGGHSALTDWCCN